MGRSARTLPDAAVDACRGSVTRMDHLHLCAGGNLYVFQVDSRSTSAQAFSLTLPAGGIRLLPYTHELNPVEPVQAPPGPFEASANPPPAVSARCHRFADIRITRKCPATSRSVALASNHSAGASRTRTRRAHSSASSPPPSEYLTPPA
jgi:hypothetical protein